MDNRKAAKGFDTEEQGGTRSARRRKVRTGFAETLLAAP